MIPSVRLHQCKQPRKPQGQRSAATVNTRRQLTHSSAGNSYSHMPQGHLERPTAGMGGLTLTSPVQVADIKAFSPRHKEQRCVSQTCSHLTVSSRRQRALAPPSVLARIKDSAQVLALLWFGTGQEEIRRGPGVVPPPFLHPPVELPTRSNHNAPKRTSP